ncbi:MAG: hypothetical protein HY270_22875, partial [Deltaproteobacteria bacterium]|nr:hypothetical protein [Deltaproteobacteria bacterium]
MRRKIAVLGSLLVAAVAGRAVAQCADPRPAPAGPAIYVVDQNLSAAGSATIAVKLVSGSGNQVAGTQNDLAFPAGVTIGLKGTKPDCTVNPDINKGGTAFSFRTANCASGSTCVRALVLALDNTDVIPDGSTLYTCNVTTSGTGGTVAVSGTRASSPAGSAITGTAGQDGILCIGGGVTPTNTPSASSCDPPRAAPAGPAIYIVDQNLSAAGSATIEAKLVSGAGNQVAGTQNDMAFPAGALIVTKNNKPDCTVNPAINKGGTAFSFRTANCPSGSTCVRALVLALDNTDVIPDGSTLFTCNVTTSGTGGTIAVSGARLSTPAGSAISGATSQDGIICIGGGNTPVPTPTQGSSSCDPPRAAPAGPAIYVVDQNLAMDATSATIEAKLVSGSGNQVAGTQNDLAFPAGALIVTKNNKPDCTVNPAINKG